MGRERTTEQELLTAGRLLEKASGKSYRITKSSGRYRLESGSGRIKYSQYMSATDLVKIMNALALSAKKPKRTAKNYDIVNISMAERGRRPRKNPAKSSTLRKADTIMGITWYRANNDVYGNPRYVTHYLSIAEDYDDALKIARKLGGRKFHNRQFGGGVAFQSYDLESTTRDLRKLVRAMKN